MRKHIFFGKVFIEEFWEKNLFLLFFFYFYRRNSNAVKTIYYYFFKKNSLLFSYVKKKKKKRKASFWNIFFLKTFSNVVKTYFLETHFLMYYVHIYIYIYIFFFLIRGRENIFEGKSNVVKTFTSVVKKKFPFFLAKNLDSLYERKENQFFLDNYLKTPSSSSSSLFFIYFLFIYF